MSCGVSFLLSHRVAYIFFHHNHIFIQCKLCDEVSKLITALTCFEPLLVCEHVEWEYQTLYYLSCKMTSFAQERPPKVSYINNCNMKWLITLIRSDVELRLMVSSHFVFRLHQRSYFVNKHLLMSSTNINLSCDGLYLAQVFCQWEKNKSAIGEFIFRGQFSTSQLQQVDECVWLYN